MSKFAEFTLEELQILDNALDRYVSTIEGHSQEEDKVVKFYNDFTHEFSGIRSKLVEQTKTNLEKARVAATEELLELKMVNNDYNTVLHTAFGIMIRLNEQIRDFDNILNELDQG